MAGAAKARQKVMVGRHDRLMGGGNENAIGRVPLSPKFSANGVIARGQKEAKQNVPLKTDRTRLVGPKVSILIIIFVASKLLLFVNLF